MLFTNILTSNLSPTDSDRLKWWSRFAHFTIVIKALVPTGNIYWVCGKGCGGLLGEKGVTWNPEAWLSFGGVWAPTFKVGGGRSLFWLARKALEVSLAGAAICLLWWPFS